MKRIWLVAASVVFSVAELRADHRVTLIPSLEITEVNDDNLNFSPDEPLRDRVRRVTPALALRFDSPRWSARFLSAVDSEQYASHSNLDDNLARERATLNIQYQATSRLVFSADSSFLGTNTLADLNTDTALAAARVRGRRFAVTPSARFRMSSTMTVTASASSVATNVVNGIGMRSQEQSIGVERRVTPLLAFTIDYEHSRFLFTGRTSQSIESHSLLAGWSRNLGAHDRVTLRLGPRFSDGSPSADISASLRHNWKRSSIDSSILRNQTAVIGYAGPVESESVQSKFSFTSQRQWIAYAEPAVFRTRQDRRQGIVYRISVGSRCAIGSFLGADVRYSRDTQHGAIDPLWANARFSHSTFSVGFITHWNDPDRMR